MEKNYSIIIPNKNNYELLARLLKSIPLREDIEIIIVDDNSDFNHFKKEEYPGLNRNNVQIIYTKEGKGAGFARNVGFKKATGKWLLFADSDDYYHLGAFDYLDKFITSNKDIVFFDVSSVDTNTLKKSNRDKDYGKYIEMFLSNKDPNGDYIKYRKWEPWFKMFRRDFIIENSIFFEEIPRCNDMIFSLKASYFAENIDAINQKLYCVTTNPNSITRKKISKEVFWHCYLCEIKKNYLYALINRRKWRTHFFYITLYLLKNNGIIETISFYKMISRRSTEIKELKKDLMDFFVK